MVGRVFVGIGVGLGLSIDPLYISEVSPPSHRGHLVSFSEIAINFGIMLGACDVLHSSPPAQRIIRNLEMDAWTFF